MIPVFYAFAIALLGVGAFHLLSLPLPWLLGPIFSCLIAALLRVPLKGIKTLNNAMRGILGVAVGATLTPAVLASIPTMWPTLILVMLMTVIIGAIGVPYFIKFWKFDFTTAYYASMPGGLQDMLIFGEEAGGNIRTLSLVHATRVFVVVVILPFLLASIWDADLSQPPGVPASTVPLHEMLLMVFCVLVGWQAAKWVGMFGASILGPLILAAVFTSLDLIHFRPPAEAIWAAQFFIGMTIGGKYVGITMAEIRRDVSAALGLCLILFVLTVIFVEIVYSAGLAPGMEALLAFAPGGQAEMVVLALIVGADVAFVVAHHTLRIFFIILGAPIAARFLTKDSPD
ncbi:MAG: AbrB family transcriptional regulator [Pseudomonadota bacterium]